MKIPKISSLHFRTTAFTFLILIVSSHVQSVPATIPNTTFILQSCKTTTYPSLCAKTLTPYASAVNTNPQRLCSAALTAAVNATDNCSATVSKILRQKGIEWAEASAIKECIGDLKDAVGELQETAAAMGHLVDADREFQWASAKTYASAAITDADTCVGGVSEGKVTPAARRKIRGCVLDVEMMMSNALSLINHLY